MRENGGCKIKKYLDRWKEKYDEVRLCPIYPDLNDKERLYCEKKNCGYKPYKRYGYDPFQKNLSDFGVV